MPQNKNNSSELVRCLERSHQETLLKTNGFYETLLKLRYEGKPSLGKNLRAADEVLKFFHGEHKQHMNCEENVIFPFLMIHVPKLESVIQVLRADHHDFKNKLQVFENLIAELAKDRTDFDHAAVLEKIREVGTYMIYLLRSHNQFESSSIHKVMETQLHADEIEELQSKVENYNPQRQ